MKHKKTDLQKHLEEKFKKLIPDEDAPEDLKEEVFQTLDTLNLIGDIADLFTEKFAETEAGFLEILGNDESEDSSEK